METFSIRGINFPLKFTIRVISLFIPGLSCAFREEMLFYSPYFGNKYGF